MKMLTRSQSRVFEFQAKPKKRKFNYHSVQELKFPVKYICKV